MFQTALNMATKAMANDLKKEGILVMSMLPGWVKPDKRGVDFGMDGSVSTEYVSGAPAVTGRGL